MVVVAADDEGSAAEEELITVDMSCEDRREKDMLLVEGKASSEAAPEAVCQPGPPGQLFRAPLKRSSNSILMVLTSSEVGSIEEGLLCIEDGGCGACCWSGGGCCW